MVGQNLRVFLHLIVWFKTSVNACTVILYLLIREILKANGYKWFYVGCVKKKGAWFICKSSRYEKVACFFFLFTVNGSIKHDVCISKVTQCLKVQGACILLQGNVLKKTQQWEMKGAYRGGQVRDAWQLQSELGNLLVSLFQTGHNTFKQQHFTAPSQQR